MIIPTLKKKISSEEPYYTEETIYNHDKFYVNQSQTPSFLKESLKGTPTKSYQKQSNLRTDQLVRQLGFLSDRIYGISLKKGQILRQQIEKRKKENLSEKTMKVKTIKLKDLLVQDKQNKCVFKERPLVTEEHKDDYYGNFEMDENLNYIQNLEDIQGNHPISTIEADQKDNWLSSEENNSREASTIQIKEQFSISANSTKRKKKQNKSYKQSIELEKPKGVYEQILSLYSTAKLLALKRQFH